MLVFNARSKALDISKLKEEINEIDAEIERKKNAIKEAKKEFAKKKNAELNAFRKAQAKKLASARKALKTAENHARYVLLGEIDANIEKTKQPVVNVKQIFDALYERAANNTFYKDADSTQLRIGLDEYRKKHGW